MASSTNGATGAPVKHLLSGDRPRVLIVGGCDVHRRIDLMRLLAERYSVAAVGSERRLQRYFDQAGIEYYHYPLRRGFDPVSDVQATLELVRLFRALKPDIVHTFATKPSTWGRLAARMAEVPVVIGTLPGLGSLYADRRPHTRVMRMAYEVLQRLACTVSDATIFQNRHDAQEFVSAGVVPSEKAVVVLGSGVRTEVLNPGRISQAARIVVRAEFGAEARSVVVTMISRLIRSKGVLEFVEAASVVKYRNPLAEFVLIGPHDHDSLEHLGSRELERVRRSVRWFGERSDVPTILASSDVFVLPSFYREGIPRVLLEAASMGLPLITTRAPGCSEVVEDGGNGILVPPKDPASLANAIGCLVSEPELRRSFGKMSRELAVRQFDLAVVAQQVETLYGALLDRQRITSAVTGRELAGSAVNV